MNSVPHSHDAGMSPRDVIVELDGYMTLSNVTFIVGAGTLTGVSAPTEPVRAAWSTQLPGRSSFTREE